jgi:hypothetical protein
MRCLRTNHRIGITESAAKFGELGGEAATIYILKDCAFIPPPEESGENAQRYTCEYPATTVSISRYL